MNTNTFTPGPWKCTSRNVDAAANWASRIPYAIEVQCGAIVAPIADVVADPLVLVCDQPHAEANAHLIAAAPDMYVELRSVLDWAVQERAPLRDQEIASIRAVLAKAGGAA